MADKEQFAIAIFGEKAYNDKRMQKSKFATANIIDIGNQEKK
ncbi:MAG: hypothetical protein PHO29_10360 [Acetobacterium sp.]|nr:hypothetical protein [Acetobacterium sp.]